MNKLKPLIIICAAIVLLADNRIYSQSYIIHRDTISFAMKKMTGMGLGGNMSFGVGSIDSYSDKEDIKGFPKIKNKPEDLRDIVEYIYILDDFQFYYQNYCAGIYSREFFLKTAVQKKWNLADTVKLSKKPIKCSFSVLAGFNQANEAVYIIDADNDGDFGDDVIKPVQTRSSHQDLNGAIPVQINYLAGRELKSEKLLVLPVNTTEKGKISLFFMFPEFRYVKFNYEGQSYFICSDVHQMQPVIAIMPDVPNFDSIPFENRIKLNQYVRIGNKDFKFAGYTENGNKISLTGDNIKGFATLGTNPPKTFQKTIKGKQSKTTDVFSSQSGFKAPIIKGYNINDAVKDMSFVSTADLKGKYIFVDFWSTTCAPCIAEFPYLKEAYLKYNRKQFEIVGVLDERGKGTAEKLLKEQRVPWPNVKTNTRGTEIKGYDVNSYPTSYLINPEGKIVAVNLRGDELSNKLKGLIKN